MVLAFVERKQIAKDLITKNILETNPELSSIDELSEDTKNELNDAVFKLTNVLGKVQYEVLNKDTNESLTVS